MASTYEQRQWLARYDAGMPSDITPSFTDALTMFRDAVRRHADRPLIHYFDRTLAVGEVDRMTDALGAGLVSLGVKPGDRVAVYLQNIPQFVLAMIATWKAGAVMVSINPMSRKRESTDTFRDNARLLRHEAHGVPGLVQRDHEVPLDHGTHALPHATDG